MRTWWWLFNNDLIEDKFFTNLHAVMLTWTFVWTPPPIRALFSPKKLWKIERWIRFFPSSIEVMAPPSPFVSRHTNTQNDTLIHKNSCRNMTHTCASIRGFLSNDSSERRLQFVSLLFYKQHFCVLIYKKYIFLTNQMTAKFVFERLSTCFVSI